MTSRDKVIAGAVVACVGMVVLGACGIFMSADKWHDLGRLLTTPPGSGSALGLALVVLGGMWAARHTPAPALLLAAGLGAATLSGCTAADWQRVGQIAKPLVEWTCGAAKKVCELDAVRGDQGGSEACGAIALTCGIAEPIVDSLPTSGGESSATEPHTIDGEDDAP